MGAYSRWALIRGWALIRINTVSLVFALILCPIKSVQLKLLVLQYLLLERFSLDCRKTKTKVNTLAGQKGVVKPKPNQFLNYFRQSSEKRSIHSTDPIY